MKYLIILFCLVSVGASAQVSFNKATAQPLFTIPATFKLTNVDDSTYRNSVFYSFEDAGKVLKVKCFKTGNDLKPAQITGDFAALFELYKGTYDPTLSLSTLEKDQRTFVKVPIEGNKYWLVSFYKTGKDWIIKLNDY